VRKASWRWQKETYVKCQERPIYTKRDLYIPKETYIRKETNTKKYKCIEPEDE